MSEYEKHGRRGVVVRCSTCDRMKSPVGRSAPLEMANSLCDRDCPGYRKEPYVGSLWPGETCEEFGYAHSHDGTEEVPR